MTPLRTLVAASVVLVQAWTWVDAERAVDARWWFSRWLACAAPFLIGIALSATPRGVRLFVGCVWCSAISAVLCAQRFEVGVGILGGAVAWQIAFAACLFTTWVLLPIGIASYYPWLQRRPWRMLALMLALVAVLECSGVGIYRVEDVINQGAANGRLTEDAVVPVFALYLLTALALALSLSRELRRPRVGTRATQAARATG